MEHSVPFCRYLLLKWILLSCQTIEVFLSVAMNNQRKERTNSIISFSMNRLRMHKCVSFFVFFTLYRFFFLYTININYSASFIVLFVHSLLSWTFSYNSFYNFPCASRILSSLYYISCILCSVHVSLTFCLLVSFFSLMFFVCFPLSIFVVRPLFSDTPVRPSRLLSFIYLVNFKNCTFTNNKTICYHNLFNHIHHF